MPLPNVDPHVGPGENLWGVFACAAVDPAFGRLYFGLGGYSGIDAPTTPFMRICDWLTLDDAWPTVVGADTVTRYSTAHPPMYMTSESGLSSPVVVNDVIQALPTVMLNLSADHRVLDGVAAAVFLARVRELIEAPALLLI